MKHPLAIAIGLATLVLVVDVALPGFSGRLDGLYLLLVFVFRSARQLDRSQAVTLTFVAATFTLLPLVATDAARPNQEWFYRGTVVVVLVGSLGLRGLEEATCPKADARLELDPVLTPPIAVPRPPRPTRLPARAAVTIEQPKAGRDRREFPRFKVGASVQVAPFSGGKRLNRGRFREFACRDLSQNGLAFLAPEVLTWNLVVVAFPSRGESIYRVAEIMRRRAEGGLYLYGCQFTDRTCPRIIDDREMELVPRIP